jgi:hypothetical protein
MTIIYSHRREREPLRKVNSIRFPKPNIRWYYGKKKED